jgi:hypothetical protein
MKVRNQVIFNRSKKVINFDGTVIIDLRPVAENAKARLFSKLEKDAFSYDTVFSIQNTEKPFHFGSLLLGTEGFVAAVVENRLEIEGMLVKEGIEDAYKHIWGQ